MLLLVHWWLIQPAAVRAGGLSTGVGELTVVTGELAAGKVIASEQVARTGQVVMAKRVARRMQRLVGEQTGVAELQIVTGVRDQIVVDGQRIVVVQFAGHQTGQMLAGGRLAAGRMQKGARTDQAVQIAVQVTVQITVQIGLKILKIESSVCCTIRLVLLHHDQVSEIDLCEHVGQIEVRLAGHRGQMRFMQIHGGRRVGLGR